MIAPIAALTNHRRGLARGDSPSRKARRSDRLPRVVGQHERREPDPSRALSFTSLDERHVALELGHGVRAPGDHRRARPRRSLSSTFAVSKRCCRGGCNDRALGDRQLLNRGLAASFTAPARSSEWVAAATAATGVATRRLHRHWGRARSRWNGAAETTAGGLPFCGQFLRPPRTWYGLGLCLRWIGTAGSRPRRDVGAGATAGAAATAGAGAPRRAGARCHAPSHAGRSAASSDRAEDERSWGHLGQ